MTDTTDVNQKRREAEEVALGALVAIASDVTADAHARVEAAKLLLMANKRILA